MKCEIELYINDNKVDIINSESFAEQFAITLSYSDLYSPEKVTDSYSKSIDLPGTASNNKIFANIWKLDAEDLKFNPSQISDFKIYLNKELWQSGTAQLTEITRSSNVYTYKVSLFGTITKVMSILTNKDLDDPYNKLLRNLKYPDKLRHKLVPRMLLGMWAGNYNTGTINLSQYMQYIPCQNGLYDNFSSSKVLRYDSKIDKKWKVTPVLVNGNFTSGDLELDEYIQNEYRIEYQRPAIKLDKMLAQIGVDLLQNTSITTYGELSLGFDAEFFNNNNPYYSNSYMTLSQYSVEKKEDGTSIRSGDDYNGYYSGVQGSTVSTDDMFDTTTTQGDVLLSYTKLFGLLYDVNKDGNIVIKSRNKYFEGYKILDWSDKVDYSKDISIKPLTFDTRYFEMKYSSGNTFYESNYSNKFGLDYGEKKINTGYAFNFDVKDFFEDNLFVNTVISADIRRSYSIDASTGNLTYTVLEPIPMPALYKKDGETKSSADTKYNLLFRKSYADSRYDGYVSCDASTMLNEAKGGGEYCWWDKGSIGLDNTGYLCQSAIQNGSGMPVFSTYSRGCSWYFGLPRLLYDGTYGDEYEYTDTIYSKFWQRYIEEIYNVNNRILTCYVKLSWIEILNFSFKNFVTIDGVLYHPNKLMNVNPLSDNPVQVELIKVSDITAYTSGQDIPGV